MKKLIFTIIMTSFIAASCEDFINILPESTVTIDVLYKTDKDFADALVGCYSCFDNIYDGDQEFMGELMGDDMEHQWATESSAVRMDFFTFINDESVVQNYWRDHYQAISRLNLLIANLEKADASVITKRDRYMGEAKFLRGLSYFNLVRAFGDLPIVTAPISFTDAYKNKRQPVAAVYDVIYTDLQDAETKLPVKYTGADVGRATQGAAKSLLGKAYLTQKDFVKAESKLKEVTTMGYALLPNYNDLWDYSKDEHHKEYIFDIEYESGQGYGSGLTNTHIPQESGLQAFLGIKGGGGSDLAPSDSLLSDPRKPEFKGLFIPGDKRREKSVANGYTNASGVWVPLPVTGLRRSFTMKYTCPVPAGGDSPANFKVIRYADVVLMLAEALNENGKTDEALTWLNMIRTRAGVPTYTGLSKSTARAKIELERRLELCFEGHRWWDLLRTGRAMQVMGPAGMKEKHWLYPIPLSEMQVVNNPDILRQNPGWE
jgi:hypothetical protein